MGLTRRQTLSGGVLALLGTGFLGRVDKVAAMQKPLSMTDALKQQANGTSEALLLEPTPGEEGPPNPATYDRLPLEWNKKTVQRFKDKLAEKDIEAFLVRTPLNLIYLTGYWHSTTERPQAAFMNGDDKDPWYLYPGLDRDLVTSWWFGGGRMYFDFHHAEGAFPHEGKVQQGKMVDLFTFMLEGLKEHGIQGTKIGIDGELYPSEIEKAKAVLAGNRVRRCGRRLDGYAPGQDARGAGSVAPRVHLLRPCPRVCPRLHPDPRNGHHGLRGLGRHRAVDQRSALLGSRSCRRRVAPRRSERRRIGCRAGRVTGFPHPNQPYYNRIGRGMALQISGGARIGGYGHENYRAFIIADEKGAFDPHMQKLWQVSRDCCDMQMELSVEGVTCSSVAYQIHKYQVKQGVQKYIYHRPAHGAGVEGHQSP